jgi:hypothetical protein
MAKTIHEWQTMDNFSVTSLDKIQFLNEFYVVMSQFPSYQNSQYAIFPNKNKKFRRLQELQSAEELSGELIAQIDTLSLELGSQEIRDALILNGIEPCQPMRPMSEAGACAWIDSNLLAIFEDYWSNRSRRKLPSPSGLVSTYRWVLKTYLVDATKSQFFRTLCWRKNDIVWHLILTESQRNHLCDLAIVNEEELHTLAKEANALQMLRNKIAAAKSDLDHLSSGPRKSTK